MFAYRQSIQTFLGANRTRYVLQKILPQMSWFLLDTQKFFPKWGVSYWFCPNLPVSYWTRRWRRSWEARQNCLCARGRKASRHFPHKNRLHRSTRLQKAPDSLYPDPGCSSCCPSRIRLSFDGSIYFRLDRKWTKIPRLTARPPSACHCPRSQACSATCSSYHSQRPTLFCFVLLTEIQLKCHWQPQLWGSL